MITKTQIKKIEKNAQAILDNYNEFTFLDSQVYLTGAQFREKNKRQNDDVKMSKELTDYLIKINISEDDFYSVSLLNSLYDGVNFEDFINQ